MAVRRRIADLEVFPLCLGGNVFGWTVGEQEAFKLLDAYAAAGGNFLDTADSYTFWQPGNPGGESERIIGRWLTSRAIRTRVVVATKVGLLPGLEGLSAKTIRMAVEASLRRLQTDYIDLYLAHRDDPETPLDETLEAFDGLVRDGKVRYVGASNFSAPRLAAALSASRKSGWAPYAVLQTRYNLMERERYEAELAGLCAREGLPVLPYFGLARGFLTGKYRPGVEVDSPRAGRAALYLESERGRRVLAALDEVAGACRSSPAAVALAWLAAQPDVAAVVASCRTPDQLADLLPVCTLVLGASQLQRLSEASAGE